MEVMLKQNENLKVVEEEHEQLKIAFAEQSQRSVGRFTFLVLPFSFEEDTIFGVLGMTTFSFKLICHKTISFSKQGLR